MNWCPTTRACACVLIFACFTCHATEEQVVIVGQRPSSTAPGIDAARAEAARVAGGASVVGREEYSGARSSNLYDVFALTAGVFVQPRFGAEEARLSIRGSGLQRTFHMRGITLLQDGVPITLADGGGDFQAIEPLALAYTEVLRGANALQFGGTSLGGAINFVSPSGHDAARLEPRLEVGSFGYRRAMLSSGDVLGRLDYFLSASAYSQDGSREWSRQSNQRLFGNFGVQVREGIESRFYFGAVHSDSQLPGAVTKAQLRSDPSRANAGNVAGRHKRDFELYRIANRTVFDLDTGTLEASFGYSYKDLWHPIFQVIEQRSSDYSAGVRYLNEMQLAGRPNRLVLGVWRTWNSVDDERFANLGGVAGEPTAQSAQSARNLTVYGESHLSLTNRWSLIAGAQWTEANRRYRDRFLVNGDQGLDATYQRTSPKLGLLWRGGEDWSIFANVSDSFEPPSFGELSGGPGVDLLEAQSARSAELGTRGRLPRVGWEVVAYTARVRNELLSLNAPDGQPLGTRNAPRTNHRGIEAAFDAGLWRSLTWRSAHLWSDFRFDGNESYGNNTLPGIPRSFHRGELSWSWPGGAYITLTGEWSPRRYPVDMANTWFADPYALWGMRAGRRGRGVNWFVELRNAGDQTYAATTGVVADARGQDVAQFLPGDGRAVYFGVDWRSD